MERRPHNIKISNRGQAVVLLLVFICSEVAWVVALISGPTYQRVLELSDTQMGLCLGAMPLGNLIMSAMVGHGTARHGALRVFTLGILGMILGMAVVLMAPGMGLLLLGLVLAGAAVAALHNGGLTLLADLFPKQTRRIMALAAAAWFGSSVVSAPLIGLWLAHAQAQDIQRWSFGVPFAVVMVLLGGGMWMVRLTLKSLDSKPASVPAPAISPMPQQWRWLWIPALAFCHGLMLVTFMAWANPMVQSVFQTDDFYGGLAFSVFALGLTAGRLMLVFRRAIDNDRLLLAGSALCGGLCLGAALMVSVYGVMLVAIGLGAFLVSATAPCLFSLVAGEFSRMKSRLYGYQEASIGLGGIVGPLMVGVGVDHGAPVQQALLIAPGAACLLGVVSLLWLWSERGTIVKGSS